MTIASHLSIFGSVQGVFYRGWAVEMARELGLAGWVRNRSDGTVEALVQGNEDCVERFIELAWKGPVAARVERIERSEAAVEGGLAGFTQEATV